jgi:hypothetical protein
LENYYEYIERHIKPLGNPFYDPLADVENILPQDENPS